MSEYLLVTGCAQTPGDRVCLQWPLMRPLAATHEAAGQVKGARGDCTSLQKYTANTAPSYRVVRVIVAEGDDLGRVFIAVEILVWARNEVHGPDRGSLQKCHFQATAISDDGKSLLDLNWYPLVAGNKTN